MTINHWIWEYPIFWQRWCFWAIHVSLTKFGNPCHHRGRYRARSRVAARSLFFWIPSNTKMSTLMGRWRWTMRLWGSVFSDATCWVYLGGLQFPVSAFYGWFKALQSQVIEFEEGSSHKLCRSHTHCVGFLSGFPWTRSQRNLQRRGQIQPGHQVDYQGDVPRCCDYGSQTHWAPRIARENLPNATQMSSERTS